MAVSGKGQDGTDFALGSAGDDARPPPGTAAGEEQAATDALAAQVRRQVQADPRLRARVSEHELTRLIDETVSTLWRDSTVKSFVAALALRQVREQLERREERAREHLGGPS